MIFNRNSIYIKEDMGIDSPLDGLKMGNLKILIAYQKPNYYFEIDKIGYGADCTLPKEKFRQVAQSWIGIISDQTTISGQIQEIELHRKTLTLQNQFVKNICKKN
jgi:hypothetical protein